MVCERETGTRGRERGCVRGRREQGRIKEGVWRRERGGRERGRKGVRIDGIDRMRGGRLVRGGMKRKEKGENGKKRKRGER
jgi:hypothetical protein